MSVSITVRLSDKGIPNRALLNGISRELLGKAINLHPSNNGPGFHGIDMTGELWVFTKGAKLAYSRGSRHYLIYGYSFDGSDILDAVAEMTKMLQKAMC